MKEWIQRPQIVLLIAALTIAVVAAGLLVRYYVELPDIETARLFVVEVLETIPTPVYFLAFAILPAFCVPMTLFYLTALPIMGSNHVVIGVMLAWLALLMNMALTRVMATGIMRPQIERLLRNRNRELPSWNRKSEWQVVLAVRLSPLPFPLQNYLLALGNARWLTYLWLSWPIQAALGLGMMLVGKSLLQGGLGYAMLAIFILLCINLIAQRFRKKLPPVHVESTAQ